MENTLYSLEWPRNGTDTYGYGAIIDYLANGEVKFQSERVSPGLAIRLWRQVEIDAHFLQSFFLPALVPGEEYQLKSSIDSKPAKSIGIQIQFFDEEGLIIDELISIQDEVDFVVPDKMVNYEVSLVNLNTREFVFHYLILGSKELMDVTKVDAINQGQIQYVLTHGDKANDANVILMNRASTVIPLIYSDETNTIVVRVKRNQLYTDESSEKIRYDLDVLSKQRGLKLNKVSAHGEGLLQIKNVIETEK